MTFPVLSPEEAGSLQTWLRDTCDMRTRLLELQGELVRRAAELAEGDAEYQNLERQLRVLQGHIEEQWEHQMGSVELKRKDSND